MKSYIGAKIILAEPMDEQDFLEKHKKYNGPPMTENPGYHVEYPGEYHSWSPKAVFEEAYREISGGEFVLMGSIPPVDPE